MPRIAHPSLVLSLALLGGCATSAEIKNPFGGDGNAEPTHMAAFAARSEFPADKQPSTDLRATALINRDQGTIQIINPSDRTLTNAKVWVNGNFVASAASIPPHATLTLSREQFYDRRGNRLADSTAAVTQVQVETQDALHNLEGPVFE